MQIPRYRYMLPVLIAALALLGATLSGCLVSGTKVFSVALAPPSLFADGNSANEERVDYTQNDTYRDYGDKIRLIDRVGFTARMRETRGVDTSISMYFSATSGLSAGQVRDQATPLFLNYLIPENGVVTISYDDSQKILLNFEQLQELAKGGAFSIYTLAEGDFNLTFEVLVFTITFTVGL